MSDAGSAPHERPAPSEQAREEIKGNEILRAARSLSLGVGLGLLVSWVASRARRSDG